MPGLSPIVNFGRDDLHRAAEKGDVEVVKFLLNHGARVDVSAQGHAALSFAEQRGHTEIAKLLRAKESWMITLAKGNL